MREIDQVEGLERIRISSIDPDEVDEDLISAVVEGKKTCPSMHIVLQSGSNLTLKRMRRKYTKQDFLDSVSRLISAHPLFTFTTDLIVGFPGETEEEFQESVDLVKKIQFAKVHVFPYSDRPKTRASRMPHKISKEVIAKRKAQLIEVAEQSAFELRKQWVGEEFLVLLESEEKGDYMMGHTSNFLTVYVPKEGMRPNKIIKVKMVQNNPEGYLGENQVVSKV